MIYAIRTPKGKKCIKNNYIQIKCFLQQQQHILIYIIIPLLLLNFINIAIGGDGIFLPDAKSSKTETSIDEGFVMYDGTGTGDVS